MVSGPKMTLIVQVAPATTLVPHVFVCAKSAGFGLPIEMPVMCTAALPRLVSVIFCGALLVPTDRLPKFRLAGDS